MSAKSDPGPQAGTTPGTYHICSQRGKAAGLTAGSGSALCSLRLDQGSARQMQTTARPEHGCVRWSGGWARLLTAVLGSGTHAAGQAEPGYGTAVETVAQCLADAGPEGAVVLVQGEATGGARDLGSGTAHG